MIHLKSFEAIHYRGIDGLSLPKLSHANLITGANGVGKTALVEAIWLFMGRYNLGLLWNPNVQRSTNPIVNPILELSDKPLTFRGTDTNGCDEWKVAFEKSAEMTWDTVVVTDSGNKMEQHPLIGQLRVWINDEELASELPYRHNTSKKPSENSYCSRI